jgi:dTDP-4-amino-4,6-dideoxygalactose transaminase
MLAPDRTARDKLVEDLNSTGLGASRFYGTDLTQVAGIPEVVWQQGPFPNAKALADRLFTLPTHALVNAGTVRATRAAILGWHRSQRVARLTG